VKARFNLILLLILEINFLAFLFPLILVEVSKSETAQMNQSASARTEKVCDDIIDNNNGSKIDSADKNCSHKSDGQVEDKCELQIDSGIPVNYGELSPGQESRKQIVNVKNIGTVSGKIMVSGGDWISDGPGNTVVSGPEATRVYIDPDTSSNNGAALKHRASELGLLPADEHAKVSFQLRVPLDGFNGSLHQELSIDLSC
jgi:hypothetical protein